MPYPLQIDRLIGQSHEKVIEALAGRSVTELCEVIYQLATCEPHITDRQLAMLRHVGRSKIQEYARNGTIAPVHRDGLTNAMTIPLSAVRRYDELTRIRPREKDPMPA